MRTVHCGTAMKGSISGAFAKVLFWLLLLSTVKTLDASDTISPGQLIRDNETLVSTGATYELGFFSPGSSTRRYLGIWFKKSTETVVWVANREIPIGDRSGVLQITNQGILVLVNGTKGVVWSSNVSRTAKSPVAQLLDSANFVVREENDSNPDRYLWQSFDYPGDTNLAGMKLGRNLETGHDWSLSSWKSLDDPARGEYTFGVDPRGYPQVMLKKGSEIQFRSGSWNGIRFTGAHRLNQNPVFKFKFVLNEKEAYLDTQLINKSVVTRMMMEASGRVERFTWIDQTHSWASYFSTGQDLCNNYAQCGANAKCNSNNYVVCGCLDGFEPKSPRAWSFRDYSQGCVRSTPLGCEAGEGFIKQKGMKLPDTSNSWYNMSMSLKECMDLCLKNCSCVASANADIRGEGSGCILWFGDLIDMRVFSDIGQDLYVRMAASYLDHIRRQKRFRKARRIVLIICFTIVFIGVVVLGWILYRRKRKLKLQEKMKDILEIDGNKSMKEDLELPTMELSTIAKATNNFSIDNKLGEGGFGPVYKGTLPDGQEIAVKRLSMSSGQGLEEFINEVLLIAKLQHRNLVRLIGCCIQGGERMLIYEYMPNKSLDYFIFDQSRKKILDWQTRINIIDGIARGLLYLHQDSRLRIIHRDLKASNVLLDSVMNPKISDFGMARIVGGDQTEANTNRVVGTYGYMAPEYAVDGLFSLKSDIFSFGVLILEIVSGRRNRGFYSQNHHHNLVGQAWRLWMDDRALELIDDNVGESTALAEFIRRIHVGLLCVQHRPEDRPNISTVVLMLSGESSLPQPKQPGFFTERNLSEEGSSSSFYKSNSTNEITVTALDPR